MTPLRLSLVAAGGVWIDDAIHDAVRVAAVIGIDVEFQFNGRMVFVRSGETASDVRRRWDTKPGESYA